MSGEQPNTVLTISKVELSLLPAAKYEGEIIVADTLVSATEAISTLKNATEIGFDTETRPSFKKGHLNNVSLIQLSHNETCYLFRINKTGIFPELKEIIENPAIKKIGVSVHDDFHNLSRECNLHPDGFVELQDFVKSFDIMDCSLSKIYAIIFGQRISKAQRLSNWEADTLSPAQKAYAALDAKACVDIYNYLTSGKFDKDKSPYRHLREEIFPATEQES